MADWQRLGKLVIARRVELNLRTREALAETSGVGLRTIGDLETGRREKYHPNTIAAIEEALQWEPGALQAAADGGQPKVRRQAFIAHTYDDSDTIRALQELSRPDDPDDPLIRIIRSPDLTDRQKAEIIRRLLTDQHRFASERADELIRDARSTET
ncbi:helix-turn-helix transcriptional regulator [Paractinoplanes ferrugineus]|nr:helix-turn-helix transcriptional regulator [Actinoplanes ferrugineus]